MTAFQRVQRVRVAPETAGTSTFAVELSGSISSFKDVRCNSAEVGIGVAMLKDEAIVQRAFQERPDIVGPKSCSLSLGMDMTGMTRPLDASAGTVAVTDTALGTILSNVLGGGRVGIGSTEATSDVSTTNLLYVTAAGTWTAGAAAGYMVNGRLEAREIDTISGGLEPKVAWSAAAGNGVTVYNAETYYPDETSAKALQWICETAERDDIYWLLGTQAVSLSLNITLGQLARLDLGLQGPKWLQDDSVGTPLGGSAIAAATFTDGDPVPFINSQCFFAANGTEPYSVSTEIDPSSVSVGINLRYEPVPSPGGVEGVRKYVLSPQSPMVTLELTLPVDSGNIKTYQAARDARTLYSFFMQVGSSPSSSTGGGTWLVSLPSVQLTDVQRTAGPAGLTGVKVSGKGLEDQDIGTTSTLTRAPFRLHRL